MPAHRKIVRQEKIEADKARKVGTSAGSVEPPKR